jgi:hypothetical protein
VTRQGVVLADLQSLLDVNKLLSLSLSLSLSIHLSPLGRLDTQKIKSISQERHSSPCSLLHQALGLEMMMRGVRGPEGVIYVSTLAYLLCHTI